MSSSYFLGVWTVAAVLIVLAVPPWRTIGMNLLDLFKRTVGGRREDGSPSAKFSVRQLRLPPLSVRGAMSSVMELARKRARQISWALAILIYASLLHHFGTIEHGQYNPAFFAFTISVTLCVALVLTFMTRRALFSAALTALMVVFIEVVARVKFEFMQFGLHSYDLIFLTSIGTVDFLWHDYRRYVLLFFGGLVLSAVLGWVCWRYDRSQVARTLSLLALLTAGGAV